MAEAIRKLFAQITFKDNASKGLTKLDKAATGLKNQFTDMNNLVRNIGGAYFFRQIGQIVGETLDVAAAFEQTSVAMEVMLGSTEKAQTLLKDIDDFSLVTPFEPDVLVENAKLMLNFGASMEDIIPNLQMLGDISGGNKEKLDRMTLAFAQVQSQGRLMGQDLLQMINAGFNPLQVISEKTGKSMRQLKDEMAKGLVSFDMVNEAFKTATSEGGKFFGMMEKQSETWNGLISTISGFKGIIFRQIGKAFMDAFKPMLRVLRDVLKQFAAFAQTPKGLAVIKVALIALSVAVGVILVVAFKALTGAVIGFIIAAWPIILIALAIIAAITTVILIVEDLYTWFTGGESVLKDFFMSIHKYMIKVDRFLTKIFKEIWHAISWPWIMLGDIIGDVVDWFVDDLPDAIWDFISGAGKAIKDFFLDLVPDAVIEFFGGEPGAKTPQKRQHGGRVSPGGSYLVGERGPELLTMGASGRVHSNVGGGGARVSIANVVGKLVINVTGGATEVADATKTAILDALDDLSENVLPAEFGIEVT